MSTPAVPNRPDRPSVPDLPIAEVLDDLRLALEAGRRAIVVAPPGAGKTTVVPLALLDEDWLDGQRIVILEPRRLATRAAAQRMAATTNTSIGALVGYQTRDERHVGPNTRVEVLTEGVLTRRLQHDPELPGVGLVIVDEVHERNLTADLALAFTLETASTIRPDLAIVAMSATPDIGGLQRVLDAPVIRSDGRMFPVDVRWAARTPPGSTVPRTKGGRGAKRPARPARAGHRSDPIEPDVAAVVQRALRDDAGDVLVFLPGIGEIRRVERLLADHVPADVDVHALAGALTLEEQDTALAPSPPGRRRVVLATDIAETSLTVAGVRIVVDSGLAREPRFDARTGLSRLTTVTTSRDSADQRTGRAGRTEPGVAYRLWSKIEHGSRQHHRSPEILQADLAAFALELAAWGVAADSPHGTGGLAFIDAPPPRTLEHARALLTDLCALDDDGSITELGRAMLRLPVHPRLARMVVAERSMLACVIACILDERDVLRGRPDDLPADLGIRVAVVAGIHGHDAADRGAVRRLRERAVDLARRAGIDASFESIDVDDAGRALLLGYPDRVAGRRRGGQFQLRGGGAAWLPDDDTLASEAFIVAADLDGRAGRSRVRLAAAVDAPDVVALFGADVVEERELVWDDDRDDLVDVVERRLGAIQLGRTTSSPAPGDTTLQALMRRVQATNLAILDWSDDARSLRDRVGFLHRSSGAPWPDWSTPTLVRTLDDWLAPYLPGATGRRDLERVDLSTVLRSQLPWPMGADLDALAPPHLDLPTGRTARIDYSGEQPSAAVRVQDLFGVTVHPTAAGMPVVLELLSPADRPIQITSDLPGFWAGSWSEVRKDMAGRYPKHQWPTDPATAAPKRLKDR